MDKKKKVLYLVGGAIGMIVGVILLALNNSGTGGVLFSALGMACVAGSTAAIMMGLGLGKKKK